MSMTVTVFERTNLAQKQLDVAIDLFLSKRCFVSSLTLVGAAEEILGKALTHGGKNNWLQHEYELTKSAM
jgi:hypothetical protein